MTACLGSGDPTVVQCGFPCRRILHPLIGLGALIISLFAGGTPAEALDSTSDPLGQSVDLAAPPNVLFPRLVLDCVSVDPAKLQGKPPPPSLDRPPCAALSASVSGQANRELLKVAGADVSVSLGLAGSDDQGFGLMRALASFYHFLNAGPLGGWQFRAEAQLGRPPNLESAYLVDERAKLSLMPPQFAGFSLGFDASGATQGGFDPSYATERSLEGSAEVSRGFLLTPWGQEHRFHLRLAKGRSQDRTSGTDQQTTRATLGYTHAVAVGSFGADLVFTRSSPVNASPATSTRVEVKFARPF